MAVVKIDPKIIFASEAPAQDTPAVFTNKTVGWGESRKNGGRPTIKQSNALQQETDLKILWLNENSVTPFDATIDYPENAVTIKDGAFKIFNGSAWNLFLSKSSVGLGNADNTSDINKPISTATAEALNLKADKDTTYTKVEVDASIDLLKPPYLASNVVDGNQTQAEINLYGGKKYDMPDGGYPVDGLVRLVNGDIVKSTIPDNTNNPNVDMTGWINTSSSAYIKDKSGLSVQSISDIFSNNSPMLYGAYADNTLHTVQEWTQIGSFPYFPNLAAIQIVYPHVTALTDSADWVATVKAMSVSNRVDFGDASRRYVFNKTAVPNNNQRLVGNFASIRQTAVRTQLFDPSNKSNFYMSGLYLIGLATDFNNSAGSRADAVYASGAIGIHIENCYFDKFSHSSLTCTQSSRIKFLANTVIGLGSSVLEPITSANNVGVVIDKSCIDAEVLDNSITQTAMGIMTGNLCSNLRFASNYIADITGQHGIYINAAQTNVNIQSNQIERTSLGGVKIQTYDVESKVTSGVSVIGNNIKDTGTDSIVVDNTSATPVYLTENIVIIGNTLDNAGQDGINARYINRGSILANVITNPNREGISYGGCIDVSIDHNIVDGAGNNGVRELLASSDCSVRKNKIKNPARNGVSNSRYGIFIGVNSTGLKIEDNDIVDKNAKMRYGLYIEAGDQATFIVRGNTSKGATDYGFRTAVAAVPFKYYADNIFEGALGSTLGLDSIIVQRGNTGREFFGSAMPTTGNYTRGDFIENIAPSIVSSSIILGWKRITTGSNHVVNTDWVVVKQSTV